ncbi:MAG: DUF937 domain-containing protein, partial [Hyphomicrobiales bacterium]|nr:DUF937 domain-containing protein [Hyphomicrobiales bacterium]
PAPAPAPAPAATAPAAPALPDVAGLTKQATDTLDGLKTTLGGITDAATATAALPKLNDANGALDKLDAAAASLPAPVKTQLGALVGPLKDEIAKVTALPGVGDAIKSATDPMLAKLDALTK